MTDSRRLLSARRSYEAPPDAIRLTALALPAIHQALVQAFGFQSIQVQSPGPGFGVGFPTNPPGLVCLNGSFTDEQGALRPIRSVSVDSRRLLIDIVDESAWLDPLRDRFTEVCSQSAGYLVFPDGSTRLKRDSSDFSVRLEPQMKRLFESSLASAIHDFLDESGYGDAAECPSVTAYLLEPNQVFQGNPWAHPRFQLELRAGTTPAETTYWSSAPLTTDAHERYLDRLFASASEHRQLPARSRRRDPTAAPRARGGRRAQPSGDASAASQA